MSSKKTSDDIVVSVRPVREQDWAGQPGNFFRRLLRQISNLLKRNGLGAKDLTRLGRAKLDGYANKDYAEVVKNFAEAEAKKIETWYREAGGKAELLKKEEEAKLARIQRLDAEVELCLKLKTAGVAIRLDKDGNPTVLPSPQGFDLQDLNRDPPTIGEKSVSKETDQPQ